VSPKFEQESVFERQTTSQLSNQGLDSLAAVEFANAISKDFVGLQMLGSNLEAVGGPELCVWNYW